MNDAVERLEAWLGEKKTRACFLSHDEHFSVGEWNVRLDDTQQQFVIDMWGMWRANDIAAPGAGAPPAAYFCVPDDPGCDDVWPGLARTIHAAIDEAERQEKK